MNHPTSDGKTTAKPAPKQDRRRQKLADALRRNLLRRKQSGAAARAEKRG